MPTTTHDIVAKLWNLCNVLKDDGVTYHQYVSELTYLLFLKMAKETGREEGIPAEWRWDVLETLQGLSQFDHYNDLPASPPCCGGGHGNSPARICAS
jgi:type I restriction enzyme M protein